VRRAERRMLGLRSKLKEAPFLKERGLDGEAFIESQQPNNSDRRRASNIQEGARSFASGQKAA